MTPIIITLFSADTVRLDEDSVSRVLEGDYPIRVKSKILAAIREQCAGSDQLHVVGFLPVAGGRTSGPSPVEETQDHYADLALYLLPEVPCRIVSDLLRMDKDGKLVCREDIVRGSTVIVISDACSDWEDVVSCLDAAGADSVKCVSILQK